MRTAKLRGTVLCLHSFGCYNPSLLDGLLRSVSFRFQSVSFRFRSVLFRFVPVSFRFVANWFLAGARRDRFGA